MTSLKLPFAFLMELLRHKRMIVELTRRDFQTKYLGSSLGILWAFLQPSVYIGIVWFVFQVGFKSQPMQNVPFVLWMLAGITPWFFFSDSLQSATGSILENSYLVKKVAFSMGILPLIKILSALIIHFFFIAVIFGMLLLYGYPPSVYNLQVFYYLLCTIALLLGISWLTSSVTLFLRDTSQIVAMVLQFLFWLTPIFWPTRNLSTSTLNLVKLNPVYYIVEGYRESFLYQSWFWQKHYLLTVYFWIVTLFFLLTGAAVFRRLRLHFADVV